MNNRHRKNLYDTAQYTYSKHQKHLPKCHEKDVFFQRNGVLGPNKLKKIKIRQKHTSFFGTYTSDFADSMSIISKTTTCWVIK